MRYSDSATRRLLENPEEAIIVNKAMHEIFKVCNKLEISQGNMIAYILDQYKIKSIYLPR